jgi:hypothetical protein
MTRVETIAPPTATHSRSRFGSRVSLGLTILCTLSLVGLTYLFRAAEQQLQEAIAESDRLDPGWRLADLEARRAVLPDEQNGMLQARKARALVPAQWPDWKAYVPADPPELVEQERQLLETSFTDLEAPYRLHARQRDPLRAELARIPAAMDEARKLVDLPHGRGDVK